MAIAGSLKTMSVPELLQWIAQGRKTGTLEVTSADGNALIAFEGGALIFSATNRVENTLGRWLIKSGVITPEKHEEARRLRAGSNIGIAKILTELHLVQEDVLLQVMKRKMEEEIYGIFLAEDGDFIFVDDRLPELDLLPLRIDVNKTVLKISQRLDERENFDFDSSGTRIPFKSQS
jgi:hypothetical protein